MSNYPRNFSHIGISVPDVEKAVSDFEALVASCRRDPAAVAINLQIMDTANLDKLKRYRDLGIERATVGVAVDMWDRPDEVMPMIDRFAAVIPDLKN